LCYRSFGHNIYLWLNVLINEPSQIKNVIHCIERNSAKHLARCSLVAGIGHSNNNNKRKKIYQLSRIKKKKDADMMA
jgi:hypothetical protein